MVTPFTPELFRIIQDNQNGGTRPLLFGNARIITGDSLVGDFERGDILLGGNRVVGIGPGLLTAADDDGAIVIDCDRFVIVPAVIDAAALVGARPENYRGRNGIAPGNSADFAILPLVEGESADATLQRFVGSPRSAETIIVDGRIARWDGREIAAPVDESVTAAGATATANNRLGTWIDENDFVHQHLTADGRYDETRGGRPHAFQGAFWIDGDRIDYRDDLGFWAFGEFVGDTLQHAGYSFHRS
jgi:imidazolonepropionase-like amidohydrolase